MESAFDTQAGRFFGSVSEAADWTRTYRKDHPQLEDDTTGASVLYATYFGNEFLQKIMSQPGCVGLRFYQGTGAKKERHILVVGVAAQGNDLIKSSDGAAFESGSLIGNWGNRCPPGCSTSSPLAGG